MVRVRPSWATTLSFFWTDDESFPVVPVRDIYSEGYKVLKNSVWSGGFFDFAHLSMGFRNEVNLGYAFMDFITIADALHFVLVFSKFHCQERCRRSFP